MQPYQKKTIGILLFLANLAWYTAQANAYVLQGPHLLELMIQNSRKSQRLLISQKLILYHTGQKGEVEFNETLKYVFPEAFRSDIVAESVQRIHVLSKGAALTVMDGKAVAESETIYDRYKDIILYNSRALLVARLSGQGVDVTVSSLGRFQGKLAYVVGAQYPDETVPQIWLNKDTFRPLRWLLTGKVDKNREDSLEVRYFDWQQSNKTWYPMRIEFYKNDILVREIKVHSVETAPSFPESLFDIDRLKSTYRPDITMLPDQGDKKELDEVKKTIEEFKKIYE
ncbi:MAG: hypothetical protein KKE59_05725 [Proteobacteria bacterium]|nr:hypothetical protein [Pseudomonadota bacterium]